MQAYFWGRKLVYKKHSRARRKRPQCRLIKTFSNHVLNTNKSTQSKVRKDHSVFLTLLTTMKSWCLPNFSIQIALECTLEYLNFQNFLGEHAPGLLACIYYAGYRKPLLSSAFGTHHWRYRSNITHIPSYVPPRKIRGAALLVRLLFLGCNSQQ